MTNDSEFLPEPVEAGETPPEHIGAVMPSFVGLWFVRRALKDGATYAGRLGEMLVGDLPGTYLIELTCYDRKLENPISELKAAVPLVDVLDHRIVQTLFFEEREKALALLERIDLLREEPAVKEPEL